MNDFALQFVPGGDAPSAPAKKRGFWGTIIDNVVGDDDPTTQNFGEKVGTALNKGGESLTFGVVGDEAAAAADAAIGRGSYDDRLDHYRGQERQFAEENPIANLAAEVGPALIPGIGAASGIAKIPTLAARMATGGALGGAAGGLYGYMEGEGDNRADNAANSAVVSALMGGAIPGVAKLGGMAAQGVKNRRATTDLLRNAPDGAALRDLSEAAYARADAAAPIPRSQFADAAEGIADATRRAGRQPRLAPQSQTVMDEILDAANLDRGEHIGFSELDTLRKMADAPASAVGNDLERSLGGRFKEGIDDFVATNPTMAKEASEARDMWSRMRQSEMLGEAVDRAGLAASGFENGIRNEFRTILKSKSKSRGLSPDVRAAMEEVVKGSKYGNTLRRVGRMMSVGSGAQTNMLGAGLSGGAGAAMGSAVAGAPGAVVGALLPSVAGNLAARGAEATTRRGADMASALARSGGRRPTPQQERLSPILNALLLSGAGMQGTPR